MVLSHKYDESTGKTRQSAALKHRTYKSYIKSGAGHGNTPHRWPWGRTTARRASAEHVAHAPDTGGGGALQPAVKPSRTLRQCRHGRTESSPPVGVRCTVCSGDRHRTTGTREYLAGARTTTEAAETLLLVDDTRTTTDHTLNQIDVALEAPCAFGETYGCTRRDNYTHTTAHRQT